ncbi:SAM-dependent methyltransferase [Nonomuraea sp. NPDC050556]|uniref:SAM-dependent methyltransferase n=1 Tax=Nonomuraea sp. NPDC050556 TaxID=3364369 RepID=UPI00378FA8C9
MRGNDSGQWVPNGLDTWVPNGARIYDYILGGKENYDADRVAADRMLEQNPQAPRTAQANRAFLGRTVRFLAAEAGIRQFIDIGAGLPTQRNVHEVAQETLPEARVVYVDHDPVVTLHSRALLQRQNTLNVGVAQADLRSPELVLNHPLVEELIDFEQPVAVLMVAILHFVSEEEDPLGVVERVMDALPSGSHLVISHTVDESPREVMEVARKGFRLAGAMLTPRTREEVSRFFQGLDLVEPGVVDVWRWRPGQVEAEPPAQAAWTMVGGVGRKP